MYLGQVLLAAAGEVDIPRPPAAEIKRTAIEHVDRTRVGEVHTTVPSANCLSRQPPRKFLSR